MNSACEGIELALLKVTCPTCEVDDLCYAIYIEDYSGREPLCNNCSCKTNITVLSRGFDQEINE